MPRVALVGELTTGDDAYALRGGMKVGYVQETVVVRSENAIVHTVEQA